MAIVAKKVILSVGNKYTIMRELLQIFEDPDLKAQAVDAVKSTDDERLLQKVIDTLKAGNIEERIENIISKDADAKRFVEQIADIILKIKSPIEEKNKFLEDFPKGIVDTKKLLDGKGHSFADLVGPGFNVELFKALSTSLVSQGVGPCEVALAVLSPEISWSGRTAGGGDIQVRDQAVEIKAKDVSGGRWVNTRKATMDMAGIKRTIVDAITKSTGEDPSGPIPTYIGIVTSRTGTPGWVDSIRPLIDKKLLQATTKAIADGLFNHTDNTEFQQALMSGSAEDIRDAILNVGYENYKAYSGFDGILMIDVNSESAQYFRDYPSMKGLVKVDTTYIYAPESEAMPKVSLKPVGGSSTGAGKPSAPSKPVAAPAAVTGKRVEIKPKTKSTKTTSDKGLGRERR
jgi:hypothetical protein